MEVLLKSYHLYILKDPNTYEVRYVGMTTNPKTRLSVHIRGSKYHTRNPKETWIHGLLLNGQKPIMEVIETCQQGTWEVRERFWIDFYKQEGYDLTNLASGGYGQGDSKPKTKSRITKRVSIKNRTIPLFNTTLPISKPNISLDITSLKLSARAIIYTSDEAIVLFKGLNKWVKIPLD